MVYTWKKIAQLTGWAIVLADITNWVYWIVLTAQFIRAGEDKKEYAIEGFLALVAPHTTLVPSLLAILNDISRHCGSLVCSLETPNWHWYIFPALIIPFDALSYEYTQKFHRDETQLIGASAWSLAISALACVWSAAAGTWILLEHKATKADGERKREDDLPRHVRL